MKQLLLTGLSGTLGPKVAEQFKSRGWEVIAWDHHQHNPDDEQAREAFWQQHQIDAVCHLAMGSEAWAGWLAKKAKQQQIPYLYSSTAMVFSHKNDGPYDITHPRDGEDEYALYKIGCEDTIWRNNPNAMIARIGWQFHPNAKGNNMIDQLDAQHRENGVIEASTLWYPATSHMSDTSIAFLQLIERNEPGLYHLDSNLNSKLSFFELVTLINKRYDKEWQIKVCTKHQHDQRLSDQRIALPSLTIQLGEL
ncbi:sugar nucleotide-binding protein [Vibrio sp. SCSIO 43136]|uniref:sugar nucleotide-binding protein n=1 Tax=Vibrio sp. SCSIO 43136 TaxID=2819101 RepID=UPI002075AC36|nr:sugar nucleotide-binding protein [Vibrio sp. SCSIO 43136]USD65347.1 sugar nucleotide-binding protein [Vibrio sp. SCSIO 43136]